MSTIKSNPWHLYAWQVEPDFTEPEAGWHPLENVDVGGRVGKLVSYSTTECRVAFGGFYSPVDIRRVMTAELRKVNDAYNRRLRGDEPAPSNGSQLPKLQMTPVALSEATSVARFEVEGYDTTGGWMVVEPASGRVVRNFTVRPDGRVAQSFTLQPGSYEMKRRA